MELVDYVVNTPQNTNKTILKQLVNNEKNKAVYESVEELKHDGGVGWHEINIISVKGTEEPVELFDYGYHYVKISDKEIDLINSVLTIRHNKITGDVAARHFKYIKSNGSRALCADLDLNNDGESESEVFIVCYFPIDEGSITKGVYVISEDNYSVIAIKAENIHPIDQKYLPGPIVIDLDTYGDTPVGVILNQLMWSGGGQVKATGIDKLFADLDTKKQVVFQFTVSDFGVITVQGATIVKTPSQGVTGFSFECVAPLNGSLVRVIAGIDAEGSVIEAIENIALPD